MSVVTSFGLYTEIDLAEQGSLHSKHEKRRFHLCTGALGPVLQPHRIMSTDSGVAHNWKDLTSDVCAGRPRGPVTARTVP